MTEEASADQDTATRLRRLGESLVGVLRGIFHSRHLNRRPEE